MTEDTDPRVLEPGTAPTPFTAEEIRDGCRAGKTIRVRIEVAGEEPMLRQNRYLELDDEGATLERTLLSVDGSPTSEPEADRVTWRDLQSHASFPAAVTTIEPERIETPMESSTACATRCGTGHWRRSSGSPPPCPGCRSGPSRATTARP